MGRDPDRAAGAASGFDLWIAPRLSAIFRGQGLGDVSVPPHVKAGPPGSGPWRWVERFLHDHIDTIVEAGHLSPAEREGFLAAWASASEDPATVLFTPIQVSVVASRGGTGEATRSRSR